MIEVRVDFNSIESIRGALKLYNNYLEEDEFYTDYGEDDKLINNIEFLNVDGSRFSKGQITERVKEIIFDKSSITSEELLFAYALQYEELLGDIVKTLMLVIDKNRSENDEAAVEVVCNEELSDSYGSASTKSLGLGPLSSLVLKDNSYLYLLGLYINTYWDPVHYAEALDQIEMIARKIGRSDEVLKLFCYCDHRNLRNSILTMGWNSGSIFGLHIKEYFKENPAKYLWFKEILLERFATIEYLNFTESDLEEHPIQLFYLSLAAPKQTDDPCVPQKAIDTYYSGYLFVEDSAKREAMKLESEFNSLKGELVFENEDIYGGERSIEGFFESFFVEGAEMLADSIYLDLSDEWVDFEKEIPRMKGIVEELKKSNFEIHSFFNGSISEDYATSYQILLAIAEQVSRDNEGKLLEKIREADLVKELLYKFLYLIDLASLDNMLPRHLVEEVIDDYLNFYLDN